MILARLTASQSNKQYSQGLSELDLIEPKAHIKVTDGTSSSWTGILLNRL